MTARIYTPDATGRCTLCQRPEAEHAPEAWTVTPRACPPMRTAEAFRAEVTAETVTRDQINKLWAELTAHEGVGDHPDVLACINALGLPDDVTEQAVADGRARCAAAINARAKGER